MMEGYTGFAGLRTVAAVMEQMPNPLFAQLTGRQLGMVMTACYRAYRDGKTSCGCEVVDGDTIYINALHHLYEMDDIKTLSVAIGSR